MPRVSGRGTPSLHTPKGPKDDADVFLKLNPVEDAAYNSATSDGWRRECSPDTCAPLLDDLRSWIRNPDAPPIYLIYGISGAGKTTLAYTCCKELDDDKQLGASFFCVKVFPRCRDVRNIIPTIAYQLAGRSHTFKSRLSQTLQDSPDHTTYDLDTQFEKLVRLPLLDAKQPSTTSSQLVVIINGLDECEDIDGIRTMLDVFVRCIPHLPIKFLLTSGVKFATRLQKQGLPDRIVQAYHLDQSRPSAHTDITTHLSQELREFPLTDDPIDGIARRAKGSFIYATLCARYMWSTQLRSKSSKSEQTPSILDLISKPASKRLGALDKLYMALLTSISEGSGLDDSEAQAAIFALQTVVCARTPMSVDALCGLLRMHRNQLFKLLGQLFPFLHVSEDGTTVLVWHQSLYAFMLNPQYSGKFHCDVRQHNQQLALICFEIMKDVLRFNISDREISCALDTDIPGLFDQAHQVISYQALHACCHWGYYVESAAPSETLFSTINDFLSNRLLHWMEALSLRKLMREGTSALSRVEKWLQTHCSYSEMHELAQDALDFCTSFANGSASQSTAQIYITALPTWPRTSPVSRCYWGSTCDILESAGFPINGLDSSPLLTVFTGSVVLSVATSLDGTRILSNTAPSGQSVGIWDSDSGNPLELETTGNHEDSDVITSVAFSRDGSYIASGSRNQLTSVCQVGAAQKPEHALRFQDHFGPVNAVALSPNNMWVASGSDDCSVRVWPLSQSITDMPRDTSSEMSWHWQHTRSVRSVAFSPDSTLLASGSSDCNICVMDTQTGHLVVRPITGHTDSVASVAFSPNGRFIVSGSSDCTIRIWDVSNKFTPHRDPILGHTKSINSVMFSPNSTLIVSGSSDLTIRVWDVQDGRMAAGPLLGHTKPVNTVIFTPDGTRIISGSDDQTIRVWDAEQVALYMQLPLEAGIDRASPAVRPNEMTASQMLECLVEHGCLDLTTTINQTSPGLVVGGGFGDIYSGKLRNGTDIAIKVWRFVTVTESEGKSLKRAMREIYSWSKLNHENIHKLLGVTVHQDRLGMVSRWMEHGNLQEYIQKNPAVERYPLCIQVAAALKYLHSKNMVHGDMKAGNILVSQDGVAKLTDFDHSIMSDCSLRFSETTRIGGGTLRWMAPELVILEPSHQRNKRTDIYALGMTLLEIITGSVPYGSQCRKDFQVYNKLKEKVLPERAEQFDQDERGVGVWALLVRCWDHDPDVRPSADEVLDLLRHLTNGKTRSGIREG